MESITTWFAVNLGDKISPEAVVFLVSLMPILECRGGLLAASLLNVDLWTAIPICIIGNILPIPFILLFIKRIFRFLKRFDFVVSNPPFNLDFSDTREKIAADTVRFFAGVPNATGKDLSKMPIYLCFVQHILYSLNKTGKAAIVVPTGFITAASGIAYKIRQRIIDEGWLRGVVSMPSNIFATTGTNVSVIFIDKTNKDNNIVLLDASKLGEKKKIDGNQRTLLSVEDIDHIISTFNSRRDEEGFSVVVNAEQIKSKNYSFSAGQYFSVKIEYEDITHEEFEKRIAGYRNVLSGQLQESQRLGKEILEQLNALTIE